MGCRIESGMTAARGKEIADRFIVEEAI